MPASLLNMKIRGIRSYSPYEHRAQSIDFMPLTLIVGPNGSGKTTIIEALKFIISGDEPPLSDSRRNFIHTSKAPNSSFDKNVPYASIELSFNNYRNEITHARRDIVRPMGNRATGTPAISSCFRLSNGPWKHVNQQADWGRTIPALFNLANKAILSHVILCHQDDNLWCMGDSSSVKLVFDRIFGCEQYKKEIKHIDVEIKNCRQDLAVVERELVYLKERVENLKNLRVQSKKLKQEIDDMTNEAMKIEEKITSLTNQRKDIQKDIGAYDKKEQDLGLCSVRILELEEREKTALESLKGPIITEKELSDSELDQKMVEHNKFVDETKSKMNELRSLETRLTRELAQLDEDKDKTQKSINRLQVIQLKSKETEKTVVDLLESIKNEFNIDKIDTKDLDSSVDAMTEFELKLKQNKSDQTQNEEKFSHKQYKLQRQFTTLEGNLQGLIQIIKNKELFIEKLRDQLDQANPLRRDVEKIGKNMSRMHDITSRMSTSTHVTRLVEVIDETDEIVDDVLKKIKDDSIIKVTKQIEDEISETNAKKTEIADVTIKKEQLMIEQKKLEENLAEVRNAAKESHNKLVSFNSRQKIFTTTHQHYKIELSFLKRENLAERILDSQNMAQKYDETYNKLASTKAELSKLSETFTASFEVIDSYKINKSIRGIREKLNEQKNLSNKLKSELHQDDLTYQLKEKLKELEKQELETRDRRSIITGQKYRIEGEHYRMNLELEQNKLTMSKYAESLGRIVCNKMIIQDLEKLKECFNQSLLSFHNQMIAKINQVLRSRWRQIYKGNDIDCIELVDEEIIKNKNQKGYNYYIAMIKGGVRMKMREKGSAGQKALACLIIRMALAELFVKDFALIALDEPTSNLDLSNVQSLAEAIGNYVKRRAKRNFNIQWVIITHDEQFLKALDSESSPYYYKIDLDSENLSKIQKQFYESSQTPKEEIN